MGVAAVDDDVTGRQHGYELVDEGIDGGACLDHEEDLARSLQRRHEILKGMGAVNVQALSATFHELVHLLDGAVEHADTEALALHVQHKVLAHNGETYESDIR